MILGSDMIFQPTMTTRNGPVAVENRIYQTDELEVAPRGYSNGNNRGGTLSLPGKNGKR
jgi:hypothetical protein